SLTMTRRIGMVIEERHDRACPDPREVASPSRPINVPVAPRSYPVYDRPALNLGSVLALFYVPMGPWFGGRLAGSHRPCRSGSPTARRPAHPCAPIADALTSASS